MKLQEKMHRNKLHAGNDYPYRILTVGRNGSGTSDALLNLINHQPKVDKMFWHTKDSYKLKYKDITKKREDVRLKNFKDPTAFNESLNDLEEIKYYNRGTKRKVLIVFNGMIADMISNKKILNSY